MTSPFSCSAASSGLPRLFHMSKPSSKWGPSSPGQELLCVSRRKFANLDLLRIRHFEKFDFRSDTHGTGLIHGKYQTGNRAIWLVDFLYQPSQELSRVIIGNTALVSCQWPNSLSNVACRSSKTTQRAERSQSRGFFFSFISYPFEIYHLLFSDLAEPCWANWKQRKASNNCDQNQ